MIKLKNKFIFILLFSSLFFISYYEKKNEEEKIENFTAADTLIEQKDSYIAVLEIPKINLKKGFYSLNSTLNNVDKNIQVIETSKMPDIENSNLILASHSGTSKIAYFKNLFRLEKEDIAYIYYKGKKYEYQLQYVYNEKKDGNLSIRREMNQTNLTLITCDKKEKDIQNVYIFKQIHSF